MTGLEVWQEMKTFSKIFIFILHNFKHFLWNTIKKSMKELHEVVAWYLYTQPTENDFPLQNFLICICHTWIFQIVKRQTEL